MKKVILLIGCLAVLASCGKKAENKEANTEVATEQVAVEQAEVADPFPASEAIATKTDGFRESEGVWTLYLMEKVNDTDKMEIASDAVVVLADKSEVALADLDKTALNEKSASIWMKDGKVSHIVLAE